MPKFQQTKIINNLKTYENLKLFRVYIVDSIAMYTIPPYRIMNPVHY